MAEYSIHSLLFGIKGREPCGNAGDLGEEGWRIPWHSIGDAG